jgi:DNA-binding NarL/FixJ family response regulator
MPPRILIADDNSRVRTTLRDLLMKVADLEIVEADDGHQALSKAIEFHPDLIILDLAMPVLDGLNAAREISRALPYSRIVLCSLHGTRHLEAEALKFGVTKVISKSQSDELVSTVKTMLQL